MRLVYLGSPQFAVPPLERLAAAGHEIVAVYTQPDRPKGRGQQLEPTPVKAAALRLGLPVHQPERVKRPEVIAALQAYQVPAMAVVGYGQIIPQSLIDAVPLGLINVHASLLPQYRGAAPIQWAIARGETVTGVTTMRIDAGLDTGDMLLKAATPIGPDEAAPQLAERLAALGADLLVETLAGLEQGTIRPEPQDSTQASLAPILRKEDGEARWHTLTAREIHNRLRGFTPWPGCYTRFRGQNLRIWQARLADERIPPAVLRTVGRRLLAGCAGGTALELLEVQQEGRARVPADAFRNGQRITEDERLGD